jgi:hypothetical protein
MHASHSDAGVDWVCYRVDWLVAHLDVRVVVDREWAVEVDSLECRASLALEPDSRFLMALVLLLLLTLFSLPGQGCTPYLARVLALRSPRRCSRARGEATRFVVVMVESSICGTCGSCRSTRIVVVVLEREQIRGMASRCQEHGESEMLCGGVSSVQVDKHGRGRGQDMLWELAL